MPVQTISSTDATFDRRAALLTDAVEEYQRYLVRYAFGLTKQWQDAENIVQELWKYVIVYFKEEQIKELSLLRRKTYQLFIDHYRATKRKPAVLSDELPEPEAAKHKPEAFTDSEEDRLKAAFYEQFPALDLTDQQKNVLWLSARYGFTYKEIEVKTGIAASTVGDWVALGRKKIAEQLSEGGK